jgi:hypothetical protein
MMEFMNEPDALELLRADIFDVIELIAPDRETQIQA